MDKTALEGLTHCAEVEAERDRLLASKEALVRKVKRLEDRVAELHYENQRLIGVVWRANQSSRTDDLDPMAEGVE